MILPFCSKRSCFSIEISRISGCFWDRIRYVALLAAMVQGPIFSFSERETKEWVAAVAAAAVAGHKEGTCRSVVGRIALAVPAFNAGGLFLDALSVANP